MVSTVVVSAENPNFTSTYTISFEHAAEVIERESSRLNIYPNPAKGFVFIGNVKPDFVRIISSGGKEVYLDNNMNGKRSVDISDLSPGLYILEVKTGDIIKRQKLIIYLIISFSNIKWGFGK